MLSGASVGAGVRSGEALLTEALSCCSCGGGEGRWSQHLQAAQQSTQLRQREQGMVCGGVGHCVTHCSIGWCMQGDWPTPVILPASVSTLVAPGSSAHGQQLHERSLPPHRAVDISRPAQIWKRTARSHF